MKNFIKICVFPLAQKPTFLANQNSYLAQYHHQEETFKEETVNFHNQGHHRTLASLPRLQII